MTQCVRLHPEAIQERDVIRVIHKALSRSRRKNFLLKEAVTLYQLSDAGASCRLTASVDIIPAMPSVATLTMPASVTGEFVELTRKYRCERALSELARIFATVSAADTRILDPACGIIVAHGIRARALLCAEPPKDKADSFVLPDAAEDRGSVIGMLNAYSVYARVSLSEGQRRLLTVLASRAAVSIENASAL